ncbi:Hypp4131 [Branchiostoma lanceolatum]|uniref:Hypp4131 protein n=1 Tax=Branchiostoma lanceolatum TaxID=7740 RepID=A0A8K0EUH0_BRALA|nr:Hypp4131 [Branchiostoma lanceolatum]
MQIQGYDLFTSDLESPNTRGRCVYTKAVYKAKQVIPPTEFADCTWVSEQGRNDTSLLIGTLYRSGSPALAITRDLALHETLKWAVNTQNSHVLITGDFNHPNITWTPSPQLRTTHADNTDNPATRFIECLRDTFLYQHVTRPTRYRSDQTPTLDDLVLSNEEGMIEQITHEEPLGASDHVRIEFNFVFSTPVKENKKTTWRFDRGNYEMMSEDLNLNWDNLLESKSTQEAYALFQQRITKAVLKHVPTKTIDLSKKKLKPLWMDEEAFQKLKKKHHAWIRYLNTKDQNDWLAFKRARNAATHASRKARKSFERKLATEAKHNNKAFWNYVNSRRKTRTQVGDLKDTQGNFTAIDSEKAEILNNQYFRTFTQEDHENIPTFPRIQSTTALNTINITEEMVLEQLQSLRVDKSPGIDGVHPRVLKETADVIVGPLTRIFQTSINEGKLPDMWREACITPIYKKGDKSDPANYRPVSLTSVPCKMLERIIVNELITHIRNNDLTCEQQHGFTHGKSTITNLLEAMDVWIEALSHSLPVDVIFLDYAKAFDTVPHERLLRRVESFGIGGNLLQWIRNFLTQRRQQVVVNGSASSWKPVISGVPQGSVLGPLLFTIFVSDIPETIQNFVSLFADDTKIYAAAQNCELNAHTTCLQADLNSLHEWSTKMQMQFHPDKCKVMHLGKANPRHKYTMNKVDGTKHTLESIEEEKDLGVTIDKNLTFSKHAQVQANKANKTLGLIKHTFSHVDSVSFSLLYKSLVRPHLEYATAIWYPKTKRDRDMVERVQRRATKLVKSLANLPYSERLKELDLPMATLHYRRQRADIIQLFKITHGFDKVRVNNHCNLCGRAMFTPSLATNTRGRENETVKVSQLFFAARQDKTRHQFKYQIQKATGPRAHFFPTRVTPAWNKLSQTTVNSKTVKEFKIRLGQEWGRHPDLYEYQFTY